jgi:glycosyltransferase involved in cell wall biosynthesis
VIPNGLEDESFDPVPRCPPRDEPLLVAVSDGFTRWKNVHALLLAHARLPTGRLELIGWDYEPGGLAEQWARARGLGERVTFAGSMSHSDVLERIRAADVLVHPSLEESFGMVVLEALARGTPVVAGARSGAVPWLLDGGRVGELVDVTDPAALAAGVERLLADGGRWEERSRAGHAHAWEHFRMSQVASAYLEAYGGVSVA